MKKCTRCRKTYESMEENFPKEAKSADGYATRCKRCRKYTESPAQRARIDARRYIKDKWKLYARERARSHYDGQLLWCAVLPCEVKAEHLHHFDYKDALAVVPLCEKHHKGIHD